MYILLFLLFEGVHYSLQHDTSKSISVHCSLRRPKPCDLSFTRSPLRIRHRGFLCIVTCFISDCVLIGHSPYSDIRQVPDNQEVYLDKNGFTFITIDILERVESDSVFSDAEAAKYHLEDILESDEDHRIWSTGTAELPQLE